MSLSRRDRELGLDRPIGRRDFLNGAATAIVGSAAFLHGLAPGTPARSADAAAAAYPPAGTGYRGHHTGSFEAMHGLVDGSLRLGAPEATGERYDLVVIGGGISGLTAAWLYRQQAGPRARILILENHDDFGGHAKRNELTSRSGRTLIGYGGSQSLQTPSFFSPAVQEVLRGIGVRWERFTEFYDQTWSDQRGLAGATFFDAETFGRDALVRRDGDAAAWAPATPLSAKARAELITLVDTPPDYLPGRSREQKLELLARTSYERFLLDVAKVDSILVELYQHSTTGYFGAGIDAVTALDARANGNPGFAGMDLGDMPYRTMSPSGRLALVDPDPYIYHFPDGNAGVARALVRALLPEAVPGGTMEDLVAARVDYGWLDREGATTRIRLGATAVRVKHDGPVDRASEVELLYLKDGRLARVVAGHVVLACWHRVIPHLTDELPPEQVAALNDQQRVPLVYTNVLIADWRAFEALRIDGFRAPGHFWHGGAELDFPVSMGGYRYAQDPGEPVLLHMSKIPTEPGLPAREQAQAGRAFLYGATYEEMERQIRDLLGRALAGGGFDPARDIEAITINRWAHGYAYEYMRPWDAFWPDGPLPITTARRPWGRVAVANADSGAYAYAHSAIDQAARAVRELLGAPAGAPAFADFPGPPRSEIGLG